MGIYFLGQYLILLIHNCKSYIQEYFSDQLLYDFKRCKVISHGSLLPIAIKFTYKTRIIPNSLFIKHNSEIRLKSTILIILQFMEYGKFQMTFVRVITGNTLSLRVNNKLFITKKILLRLLSNTYLFHLEELLQNSFYLEPIYMRLNSSYSPLF